MDIDVCLAAAIEDKPMVGLRRSARLGAMSDEHRSLPVAQLLQEQTEEEAVCVLSYCSALVSEIHELSVTSTLLLPASLLS